MGARKSGLLVPRSHGIIDVPGHVRVEYYGFADGSRYNQFQESLGNLAVTYDGYVDADLTFVDPPEVAEPLTHDKLLEMMAVETRQIPEFS